MGLFGRNINKIIQEFKKISEYYSNDLSRDIDESFKELKSDYDESSTAVPEFKEIVDQLKHKLDSHDVLKLEAFSNRLAKLNRSAKNGVEAMYEISRNQRKITSESLLHYDEFEN